MTESTAIVAKAIEGVTLNGVLAEVTALIPVVLPVAISFLAVRTGIGFLMGTLQNA